MKEYVEKEKRRIRDYVIKTKPRKNTLVIFQFGDNESSNSYARRTIKDCEEVGLKAILYKFPEHVQYSQALKVLMQAQDVPNTAGVIIQTPIPELLYGIVGHIRPEFDVDGLLPESDFIPATPKGIIELLDNVLNYDFVGKVCTVIGKSHIVGEPCANLIKGRGATIIWCDSHTVDLKRWCLQSDIIITATGKIGLIKPDMIRTDTIVIDVGTTYNYDGKLYGDVDRACYSDDAMITPVPGGVGLLTRLALIENLVYEVKQ